MAPPWHSLSVLFLHLHCTSKKLAEVCVYCLTHVSRPVNSGQILTPSAFSPAPGYSAAIAWAEREIGLSYSFSVLNDSQGVYAGFVVPTPSPALLNSSMSARWLTDVVGVNPYCTWANPGNLTAASLNFTLNSTNFPTTAVSVHLEDVDLQVSVPSAYFRAWTLIFRAIGFLSHIAWNSGV